MRWKLIIGLLLILFCSLPVYGMNSLVKYQDIPKMKELGVSEQVVDYLMNNQTSSIGSADVIQMKQSGMSDKQIMAAIKADLYNSNATPTVMEEAELVAKLKQSGLSDEAVLQFIEYLKTDQRRHVDSSGRSIKTFSSESPRPFIPTEGATFPEYDDYWYDPYYDRYHYNINVRPRGGHGGGRHGGKSFGGGPPGPRP
ncbi:MAG: hypothetical protein QNI95_10930 [Desulfobacterales bacterium]|nr:hypothetical protein [Desulfobacterales bacterium]